MFWIHGGYGKRDHRRTGEHLRIAGQMPRHHSAEFFPHHTARRVQMGQEVPHHFEARRHRHGLPLRQGHPQHEGAGILKDIHPAAEIVGNLNLELLSEIGQIPFEHTGMVVGQLAEELVPGDAFLLPEKAQEIVETV